MPPFYSDTFFFRHPHRTSRLRVQPSFISKYNLLSVQSSQTTNVFHYFDNLKTALLPQLEPASQPSIKLTTSYCNWLSIIQGGWQTELSSSYTNNSSNPVNPVNLGCVLQPLACDFRVMKSNDHRQTRRCIHAPEMTHTTAFSSGLPPGSPIKVDL